MSSDTDSERGQRWCIIKSLNCPFVLNLKQPDVSCNIRGNAILEEELGDAEDSRKLQLWKFDSESRLISKTGDALDVENWHTGGRTVIAKVPVGAQNQKWRFEDGFIVHHLTGLVVDVQVPSDGESECGAQIILNEKGAGNCQEWEVIEIMELNS